MRLPFFPFSASLLSLSLGVAPLSSAVFLTLVLLHHHTNSLPPSPTPHSPPSIPALQPPLDGGRFEAPPALLSSQPRPLLPTTLSHLLPCCCCCCCCFGAEHRLQTPIERVRARSREHTVSRACDKILVSREQLRRNDPQGNSAPRFNDAPCSLSA